MGKGIIVLFPTYVLSEISLNRQKIFILPHLSLSSPQRSSRSNITLKLMFLVLFYILFCTVFSLKKKMENLDLTEHQVHYLDRLATLMFEDLDQLPDGIDHPGPWHSDYGFRVHLTHNLSR